MYSIATIGGLFDGAPTLPIDPSWIPKQNPDGSLSLPNGQQVSPPTVTVATKSEGIGTREIAIGAAGLLVGAALAWAVLR